MTISFGNSFTRFLTPLCQIACLYSANLTLKTFFPRAQTRNDSKGGFPPSCHFYVRTQVNFTRVNNIEPMRVNVKVELRSTLFKYARSFIHCRYIIYPHKNYATVEIHTKDRGHHDSYNHGQKQLGRLYSLTVVQFFPLLNIPRPLIQQ